MNFKILVAAPVYEGYEYVIDEFIESVNNIQGEFDLLLVDNSDTKEFSNKLLEKGLNCLWLNEKISPMERIIRSRNKILDYALEKNYDYVLMMDVDVIPPENILEELIKTNKDIVSGLYFNYFKVNGEYKLRPVAWKSLTEEEFNEVKRKFRLPPEVKSRDDLRSHLTKEEWEGGEVHETMICSAGCMLVKRKVFENVRYGLMNVPEKYQTSDDIYFFNEARKRGYEIFCHTGIKCKHKIKGKFVKEGDFLLNPAYR